MPRRRRPLTAAEQAERRMCLRIAAKYCDRETGRVIKMMPEELCKKLRHSYRRMFGFDRSNPCAYLGTTAEWFVMFSWKRQGHLMEEFNAVQAERQKQADGTKLPLKN